MLVFRGYDAVKEQAFYRPLGGGIEFGETAEEAVIREMREEIGAETRVMRHLMTVENLFTYEGQPGHEGR
ncbi:MAG: NUDIX domain-containing protein, partial [Dehalococcoidia bacterium]